MSGRRHAALYAAATAAMLLTAACGSAGTSADPAADKDPDSATTVTVLAAASLTEPLTVLAQEYEREHKNVDIALSFGSSTTLAQQVAEGAPADVVAFAGTNALKALPKDVEGQGGSATIARNSMEIATPPGNPGGVRSLADLADPGLDVVLCAAPVPCGAAADEVLARAGVSPHVVSREVDVKATLAKVRLGEADAAIVYHSDVASAGDAVLGIAIPAAQNTTLAYPMLWLNRRVHTLGFTRLVTGSAGREALTDAGFHAP